jgi:predicted metal-dependent TIM-barrel fold hydrolase
MDYNKVVKEGGAADGTRAILAYYLTIYSLIQKFGNEVVAPFVIDTPNQQEQSLSNYDKILDLITNKLSKDSQIILCSLNTERLKPIKEKAKIIQLTAKKLLDETKYQSLLVEFEKFKFE